MADGAAKYDGDKVRTDLVPEEIFWAMARVLQHGAKKYAERNWEKGAAWGRWYGAARRHMIAWHCGEDFDADSEIHHIALAFTELGFLLSHIMREAGTDDRPKDVPNSFTDMIDKLDLRKTNDMLVRDINDRMHLIEEITKGECE